MKTCESFSFALYFYRTTCLLDIIGVLAPLLEETVFRGFLLVFITCGNLLAVYLLEETVFQGFILVPMTKDGSGISTLPRTSIEPR